MRFAPLYNYPVSSIPFPSIKHSTDVEMHVPQLLSLTAASLLGFTSAASKTITRDVCIIGGGSSGTYTAVQLQKQNKTVALVEKLGKLGGNVNTYRDTESGQTLDIGVIVFENTSVVNDYFDYLKVPLAPFGSGGASAPSTYADFKTGKPVKASPLNETKFGEALEIYGEQLAKYPYLVNGFDLPSQIPSDLLLTWGQFIQKYKLEAMAYELSEYLQGTRQYLDELALYILKYLNAGTLDSLINGYLTTKAHDNQNLYHAAHEKLDPNVFLNSTVMSVRRTSSGVQTTIQSPDGETIINSKQLVIAIRPILSAVQPWLDLNTEEKTLFGQFNNSNYYCSLVGNTGIPKNTTITNLSPEQPYGIPLSPDIYGFGATDLEQGYHTVYYDSPTFKSDEEVQSNISATLATLRQGLGYAAPYGEPEYIFFHAHAPFLLTVSADAIKGGFYSRLEALQGERRTFYTGAAWQTEDSSSIWNFTHAQVLPKLMDALRT